MMKPLPRRICRSFLAASALLLAGGKAPAEYETVLLPAPETVDVVTTQGTNAVATAEEMAVKPGRNRETGLGREILDPASRISTEPTSDSTPLQFDSATMMKASEVRPGQKGYGLTVFNGIRPEKFDIEVVGVRHSAMAGMDIILCYLRSPKLHEIGVVAGMSGSPVYVDGKLIGAVAYGWTTNKEALAGVTPIADMLEVFNATPGQQPEDTEGAESTFQAFNQYKAMQAALATAGPGKTPEFQVPSLAHWGLTGNRSSSLGIAEAPGMVPLASPVFLSSSNPRTVEMAEKLFPGMMITPTGAQSASAGGGGYVAPSLKAENCPGGPVEDLQALCDEMSGGYGVAVPFVEGDLNMAGVGTVTYRHGNRLVAFGHPMFEQGLTRFPMAPARINEIVRSIIRPFKVGEPLGQVGMVVQDRRPAIGGVFGPGAEMFPVKCTIEDSSYTGRREFNFRVWNNRDLAPMLVMTALQEAASGAGRASGNVAALFNYTIHFEDGTSVTKEQYFADSFGGTSAAYMVGADLGVMMTNPYRKTRPKSVEFTMRVADRLPEAQLVQGAVDQPVYRPGETVSVEWNMQPFRKPQERMSYSFRLPENLPDGTYELTVSDASTRTALDASRSPGAERVFSYESLVEVVRRNYPRNKVYVTLQDRDTGVSIRGNELPKLPGSIIDTFASTVDSSQIAPVTGNLLVDSEVVTPYDVSGSVKKVIKVQRKI